MDPHDIVYACVDLWCCNHCRPLMALLMPVTQQSSDYRCSWTVKKSGQNSWRIRCPSCRRRLLSWGRDYSKENQYWMRRFQRCLWHGSNSETQENAIQYELFVRSCDLMQGNSPTGTWKDIGKDEYCYRQTPSSRVWNKNTQNILDKQDSNNGTTQEGAKRNQRICDGSRR